MPTITTDAVPTVALAVQAEHAVLAAMKTAAMIRDAEGVAKYADALRALRGN